MTELASMKYFQIFDEALTHFLGLQNQLKIELFFKYLDLIMFP